MQIILKNEYGEMKIGRNGEAKLLKINGLGLPEKETQTINFSGQPGQTTVAVRDRPRTITMSIDFYGNADAALRLYRILYHEVEITILSGTIRRKIKGRCISQTDIESIIFHNMYKTTVQFICDDPYFHDVFDTEISINVREDKFPNLLENGAWYINLPAVSTQRTNIAGVLNRGGVNVYPVIKIYNNTLDSTTGTSSGVEIKNNTTGAIIEIVRDMKPGENITVDLPNRTIFSSIDGSIINYISDNTVLSSFYLIPGNNNVEINNKNTLQETTSVIVYNNNYEAAII